MLGRIGLGDNIITAMAIFVLMNESLRKFYNLLNLKNLLSLLKLSSAIYNKKLFWI